MGGREERVREGGESKGRRGGREVKESVGEEGKEERRREVSGAGKWQSIEEGACVCAYVCVWLK